AVPRDRPAHRHAREPDRRGPGGDLGRLAGRAGQPEVPAGDRARAAPAAVGDARRSARGPDGQERRVVSGEAAGATTLGTAPSAAVGMLIRRPPATAFDALADPAVTTRFWYTKSTGPMTEGAELTWAWEMYGASAAVRVLEVEPGRRIRYAWDGYDPARPTT